jgi:hypothetical protein
MSWKSYHLHPEICFDFLYITSFSNYTTYIYIFSNLLCQICAKPTPRHAGVVTTTVFKVIYYQLCNDQ